jgi:hypothetical protein
MIKIILTIVAFFCIFFFGIDYVVKHAYHVKLKKSQRLTYAVICTTLTSVALYLFVTLF